MPNFYLLIGIIILIILGRALYYQLKISYLKRVRKLYFSYIKSYNSINNRIDPALRNKLLEEKLQLKKLFNQAGISERSEDFMKPIGYGYLKKCQINYFENIHIPNENIARYFNDSFLEAIGFFKKRRNESFSVFYWLFLIFNIPKHFFIYFGKEPKGIFYILIDILYKLIIILTSIYTIKKNLFY